MSQMVILKRPTSEAAEIGVVGCRGPTIHTFTNDTVPFRVRPPITTGRPLHRRLE